MNTLDSVAVAAPRALGLLMAGFLALFAFDRAAFEWPMPASLFIVVTSLVPAAVVGLLVAIGWHWPLVGALGFFSAATLYAWTAPQGRVDWVLAISGPLAIVGAAFLWSWARATPRA